MRFYDIIGYGLSVEIAPGVWDDVISEVKYRGDVIRNSRKYNEGTSVNDNLTVGNSISVVADDYAVQNLSAMRYIRWSGSLWKISNVEVQRPRLILTLGGVYNGPTAPAPDNP